MATPRKDGEILVHGFKNHANMSSVGPKMRKTVKQIQTMHTTRVIEVAGLNVL